MQLLSSQFSGVSPACCFLLIRAACAVYVLPTFSPPRFSQAPSISYLAFCLFAPQSHRTRLSRPYPATPTATSSSLFRVRLCLKLRAADLCATRRLGVRGLTYAGSTSWTDSSRTCNVIHLASICSTCVRTFRMNRTTPSDPDTLHRMQRSSFDCNAPCLCLRLLSPMLPPDILYSVQGG